MPPMRSACHCARTRMRAHWPYGSECAASLRPPSAPSAHSIAGACLHESFGPSAAGAMAWLDVRPRLESAPLPTPARPAQRQRPRSARRPPAAPAARGPHGPHEPRPCVSLPAAGVQYSPPFPFPDIFSQDRVMVKDSSPQEECSGLARLRQGGIRPDVARSRGGSKRAGAGSITGLATPLSNWPRQESNHIPARIRL